MEHTLVLNATYEPIKIVHWQRAITLFYLGKVEIVREYDREVRSVSFSFKLPSVVRLLRFVKSKQQRGIVPFTRSNIYARDDYRCQYCGNQFESADLTFDHVIPQAQGGKKGWENVVACCVPCNRKKDARTPEEAGMPLLHVPRKPKASPLFTVTIGFRRTPEDWRDFFYWNISLEE